MVDTVAVSHGIWRSKLQAQVDFLAEVKAALAKKG